MLNNLGEATRHRRKQLGLSLGAVAARSGVSAAMLSDVERGKKSPTVRILSHIAEALECSISDLLGDRIGVAPRVVRADELKGYIDPRSGIERLALGGELLAHGIDVVLYRLPALSDTGSFAPHRHGVIEHLTLIRGRVRVSLEQEIVELAPGDSVTYAADVSHRYENRGRSVAELFLVIDSSRAGVENGGQAE